MLESESESESLKVESPRVCLKQLKIVKIGISAGADHIHAEHLIHASDRLTVLLSILCTSIMKHGYTPSGMLDTTLTPIVKTKTGDVTDKNNYRPIAVATSMSKVMALLVLSKTECFLNTLDNQLGFKKKHGTDVHTRLPVDYLYYYRSRPLSRRLDRCDRMIQNEGNDSRKLFTLIIALCR